MNRRDGEDPYYLSNTTFDMAQKALFARYALGETLGSGLNKLVGGSKFSFRGM